MDELLTGEGYTIIIGKEVEMAYEMVKRETPALIILDVNMDRRVSGWDVLDLLKLDPATGSIPVIMCSADIVFLRANNEHLRRHNYTVVAKPFDVDEMLM